MKKRNLIQILSIVLIVALLCAGCAATPKAEDEAPIMEDVQSSPAASDTPAPEPVSVFDVVYENIFFDYTDKIATDKSNAPLVPEAADILAAVADENNASGVELVSSVNAENTSDYYLNAYVDGSALIFSATSSTALASVTSSVSGNAEIREDGTARLVPASIMAAEPQDEIITVTMDDGTVYSVHTYSEMIPSFNINVQNVSAENSGVYSFASDKFLLRIDTDGKLVYYRNMLCAEGRIIENFAKQCTADGDFYTVFVELDPTMRHSRGGYASGMYVLMDENYKEIDYLTLVSNDDPDHTHGDGYADMHETVVIGAGHYLVLGYVPVLTEGLPAGVEGLDGGSSAYIWECIAQEIKDGNVISEFNTADYPALYEASIELNNYAESTGDGVDVTLGENTVHFFADGFMDYAHLNSLDYTLNADGNIDKLLVSLHNLDAVCQADMSSGAIEWIIGGKASSITGGEDYMSLRTDEDGIDFNSLMNGQHDASYVNKNADGTLNGDPAFSVFDNQMGTPPFLTVSEPYPDLTRTFVVTINEAAKTADISEMVNGVDLNGLSDKYHITSHCGSVEYHNDNSVVIGWGLHAVVDTIGAGAPEGTIKDAGFDDLRMGSRPIFTEYDPENGEITFELSLQRNVNLDSSDALFSYRTYKTAD